MAVLPPSSDFAVIVAEPALTAVTLPSETMATAVLLEDHEMPLISALFGLTDAVRLCDSPSVSASVVGLIETLSTSTVATSSTREQNVKEAIIKQRKMQRVLVFLFYSPLVRP